MPPTRVRLRRGTAAAWTSANPILALGEPGFETDTGQMKVGDGIEAWADRPYTYDFSSSGYAAAAHTYLADQTIGRTKLLVLQEPGVGGTYAGALRFDATVDTGYAAGPWRVAVANGGTGNHDHVLAFTYNAIWNENGNTWSRVTSGEHAIRFGLESRWADQSGGPDSARGQIEFNLDVAPGLTGTPDFNRRPLFLWYDMDDPHTGLIVGASQDWATPTTALLGNSTFYTKMGVGRAPQLGQHVYIETPTAADYDETTPLIPLVIAAPSDIGADTRMIQGLTGLITQTEKFSVDAMGIFRGAAFVGQVLTIESGGYIEGAAALSLYPAAASNANLGFATDTGAFVLNRKTQLYSSVADATPMVAIHAPNTHTGDLLWAAVNEVEKFSIDSSGIVHAAALEGQNLALTTGGYIEGADTVQIIPGASNNLVLGQIGQVASGVIYAARDFSALYQGVANQNRYLAVPYVSSAGKTAFADGDFDHTPPNGALGIVRNSTDGKVYLTARANGAWKSVELAI